ncbi:SMI1/KNR4 family protein [Pandoraea sp.]|uniref:SMI1/KNR4 family protein n=1 Tax=Pandoraea sp. TaxID=1883445 RepID=UPI0035AF3966
MSKFELYDCEQLPPGFVYPAEIQNIATSGEYPGLGPWWFIDADSKAGELAYSVRRHDGRNLIPFAKVDDGRGDVVCFDGDDASGDPKVFVLVLDDSGRSYSFANFSEWKVAALRDAAE